MRSPRSQRPSGSSRSRRTRQLPEFIFTLMVPLVTRAETFLKVGLHSAGWKLPTGWSWCLPQPLPAVSSSSAVTPSTPPVLQVLLLRAP